MRRTFAAAIFVLVAAFGAQAVPPGTADEISARLAPFGSVCRSGEECGSATAAVAAGPLSGEQVYSQFCFACHATGVGNAPILGDTAAWQPRVDKGMDTLMASTLNGLNAMPAKGTCMSCSDEELAEAVDYMLSQN
ncbi:MAG: c-type cytochrome [Pseudomonadota bacterium]